MSYLAPRPFAFFGPFFVGKIGVSVNDARFFARPQAANQDHPQAKPSQARADFQQKLFEQGPS